MALKLSEAETQVRALTRHDNDTRVTTAQIYTFLNHAQRELRTWLQGPAPGLYLVTSDNIVFEDDDAGNDIALSDADVNFENIHRVDRLYNGTDWRAIERAGSVDPNVSAHGGITFREEGGCLILGPDGRTGGTYRVVFHVTPAIISDPNAYFQIPVPLEMALIYKACALVAERDGDDPTPWEKRAEAKLEKATPQLMARHGVHPDTSGLRRVMRY